MLVFLFLAGCVSETNQPKAKTSVWDQVKFGMTQNQVHKVLGKSTDYNPQTFKEAWRQGTSDSWFFVVSYDKDLRVIDYRSMYYDRTAPH